MTNPPGLLKWRLLVLITGLFNSGDTNLQFFRIHFLWILDMLVDPSMFLLVVWIPWIPIKRTNGWWETYHWVFGLHDLGPFREKGVTMSSEKVVHSIFPKRRIVIPNSRLTLSLVALSQLFVFETNVPNMLIQDLSRNNKHILLLQPQKRRCTLPKTISSLLKINGRKVNFLWERLFCRGYLTCMSRWNLGSMECTWVITLIYSIYK